MSSDTHEDGITRRESSEPTDVSSGHVAKSNLETEGFEEDGSLDGARRKFPETIGTFRILDVLGEGGMGVVYLAEQKEPVRRRVALKLIKLGLASQDVVGRFEAERQALALMNHPNIAQVYDAGSTDEGQPFFVMEFVSGQPITKFCDRRKLGIRERLELLQQSLRGIQHAHSKGIIHRDVKPSNVLVAQDGNDSPIVKIIDFGVAKAMNQRLTERTVYTQIGRAVGTPAYMSPEQAMLTTEISDHRSDIYSFGVLLYELLVGERPLSSDFVEKGAFDEILRRIREVDPPLPSLRCGALNPKTSSKVAARRGMTPTRLLQTYRGELDWITMRALEKDPSRRYPTAEDFAQDIGHYLNDEQVVASPPSMTYRFRKFYSKNRAFVTSCLIIFSLLSVGLMTTLYLYSQARQRAEQVSRLSDVRTVDNLDERLETLLTGGFHERANKVRLWLEEAESLHKRVTLHESTLASLVLQANDPNTDEKVFDDSAMQWEYEVLIQLKKEFQRLFDDDPQIGLVAKVKSWLPLCPDKDEVDKRWNNAIESIREKYGISMTPITGVIPIGVNSQSGLWEFVDARAGLLPRILDDGSLEITEATGLVLVLIPGGTFMMGSPEDEEGRGEEELQHEVSLTPFLIGKYEVNQACWSRLNGDQSYQFPGELLPAQNVTWKEAMKGFSRIGHTLPTEAQWEFACRGGTVGPIAGDDFDAMTWHKGNSNNTTHRIGTSKPNPYGIYDMHGNVHEWCFDFYDEQSYTWPAAQGLNPVVDVDDQENVEPGTLIRVLRGGVFNGGVAYCRSAGRWREYEHVATANIGLRVAHSLPVPEQD